jgi:electron transfer flavoprotein beta subunit
MIVCVKQVPDPHQFSKITLDPVKQTIKREGIPAVINPLDKHAVEEALRLRETYSGTITALSMGPPQATEVLQDALAMGVDKAVLLSDSAFAGSDTLATVYPLAAAIEKIGTFDLILCGNESVDGATQQVGPQLAELLNVPHCTYVKKIIDLNEGCMKLHRSIEQGYLEVDLQLPALITVVKEINEYRLPTVMAIMEATGKDIATWNSNDIGVGKNKTGLNGSPTTVAGVFERKSERKRNIITGPPRDIAAQVVKELRKLEAV